MGHSIDREKVIRSLKIAISDERSTKFGGYGFVRLGIEEADIILNMLKEQEAERLDFIEAVAKLTAENEVLKRSEIVRCLDCKHEKTCCRRRTDNPDWFCADGKEK